MPCSTNRLKPTGGVICAISTTNTMKMPNQIGSIIARVSMPMFFLMVGAVMLIYFVPGIVTWLPTQMKL